MYIKEEERPEKSARVREIEKKIETDWLKQNCEIHTNKDFDSRDEKIRLE